MLGVKPTLLFVFLFPPPSAGALGLAGCNGACARRAADREKTAAMQWIMRNAAVAHVRDHPIARPIEQWVHFGELIVVLDGSAGDRRPVMGLVRAQPSDPSRTASQGASERLDFAHCAAGMPRLDRGSKTVHTLARDKRFEPFVLRVEG
jgi:hypothetical protein